MTIDPSILKQSIAADLARIIDERVIAQITPLLVEPHPEMRLWDYGPVDRYTCWIVLKDENTMTAIAYAEHGFSNMWGILLIGDLDDPKTSMGMDSGWFLSFADAYFDSGIPASLPIWRVFERAQSEDWPGMPITDADGWRDMWDYAKSLQQQHPNKRFAVSHTALRDTE
jgi:hypothetical protein